MKKVRPFEMHEEACEHLIAGIAEPNRLRCLEEQFAEASRAPAVESTALARQPVAAAASSAPNSLDTLGILSLLAFGSGDTQPPLLHPLQFALGDTNQQRFHTQEDNGISADVLRAKVCIVAPRSITTFCGFVLLVSVELTVLHQLFVVMYPLSFLTGPRVLRSSSA